VKEVSKYFDKIEYRNQHREFITHTGYLNNKRLTVMSTGIGPDNIDIVMNELDALVNIDFETRLIKEQLTSLNIIRIGTSGSLQASIPTDSFVASTHGLGLDNLLHFYNFDRTEEDNQLMHAFNNHTQLNERNFAPYIHAGSMKLMKAFVTDFHHGITVTCPGFYGPQGRILRLGVSEPQLNNKLSSFQFGNHRIANFEMETSAIYGMGKILGHHCLSLNAIVFNRVTKEVTKDMPAVINKLITKTLENVQNSGI
jgi:uridine phosphorylase